MAPGEAYRRDISITRQSHGYTFAAPGSYQVQAAFRALDGHYIMSNVAECEVKAPSPQAPEWCLASAALDTPEAQRLFKYKRQLLSLSSYTQLVRCANEAASRATSATIHFAIGKSLIFSVQNVGEGHRSRLMAQGAVHLGKAVALKALGRFREGVANSLLVGIATR